MAKILIIDDDPDMCSTLSDMVSSEGNEVSCAHDLRTGFNQASSGSFDVVFLDVMMPDGNGLLLLPEIRKTASKPEVIIITAVGDPDGAELAIRNGAWDYLQKPFSIKETKLLLLRALQYRDAGKSQKHAFSINREGIIGGSAGIKRCLDLVGQAAQSDTSVLITGETGTGKELFAFAIHNNSPRHKMNFVVVDCTALPETLVESMLFGHKKGAFTGADKPHEGLITQADGGTLFLDEVGELPLTIQKSFLRVLQGRRFRPVGGKREIESDFRLIAATNRDLDKMAHAGKFRQDLLYRIKSLVIGLPPLSERKADIRELAMQFMIRFCDHHKLATKGFSPEFIESLAGYGWPGNVRELENTMKSILTTTWDDPILFPKHLPMDIRVKVIRDAVKMENHASGKPNADERPSGILDKFKAFREKAFFEVEREYLRNLMSLTRWDIKEACRISGLSQSRLYALLKKHEVSRIQ
jgi:two-component system NtrC family response regulator